MTTNTDLSTTRPDEPFVEHDAVAADRRTRPHERRRSAGRRTGAFLAGVAATLAGGMVLATVSVSAANPGAGGDSTFVPITPCRILDTRPNYAIGGRSAPLAAGETHVQRVTGANGDCTIPTDAVAVAFNATAVQPSQASHATFYPADAPAPNASNLNYAPGTPPTPNKVDVKLSSDGRVAIRNAFGDVHMVVDVTGYYRSSLLDDLEARRPRAFGESIDSTTAPAITTTETRLIDLDVDAGVPGTIVAQYDVSAAAFAGDPQLRCAMTAPGEPVDMSVTQIWSSNGGLDNGTVSGTRTFRYDPEAEAVTTIDVRLSCRRWGDGGINILNASVTATFVAD